MPLSNLAMFGGHGLAAFGQIDQSVIAEQVGCFLLKKLAHGDRQSADLNVGRRVTAHLDEMAEGPAVGRHENLGLGGVGQNAARPRGPSCAWLFDREYL